MERTFLKTFVALRTQQGFLVLDYSHWQSNFFISNFLNPLSLLNFLIFWMWLFSNKVKVSTTSAVNLFYFSWTPKSRLLLFFCLLSTFILHNESRRRWLRLRGSRSEIQQCLKKITLLKISGIVNKFSFCLHHSIMTNWWNKIVEFHLPFPSSHPSLLLFSPLLPPGWLRRKRRGGRRRGKRN